MGPKLGNNIENLKVFALFKMKMIPKLSIFINNYQNYPALLVKKKSSEISNGSILTYRTKKMHNLI